MKIPFIEAFATDSVKKEHIDYETNWIINSNCSHNTIGDKSKFMKLPIYKIREATITTGNNMHLLQHVADLWFQTTREVLRCWRKCVAFHG